MSIKFDFTGLSRDIITLKNNYLNQQKEFFEDHGFDLHYFNARMFDSQLGRFHSNDPLIIFASPYNGMGNNPVSLVDPSGMIPGCSSWTGGINLAGVVRAIGAAAQGVGNYFGNLGDPDMWNGNGYWESATGYNLNNSYSGGAYVNNSSNGLSHSSGGNSGGGTDNSGYTDNPERPKPTKAQLAQKAIDELEGVIKRDIGYRWPHTISKGQTIYGVQKEYHWLFKRQEVQELNTDVNLDKLEEGQTIIVPGPKTTLFHLPYLINPGTPKYKVNIFSLMFGLLLDSPNSPLNMNMKPGQGKVNKVYRNENGDLFEWSYGKDGSYIDVRYYANYHKFLGRWRGVYEIFSEKRYLYAKAP